MRIDLNRGSRGSALFTLAATGVFGGAAAAGALFPERFLTTPGLTERIISGICAVVILPAFVFSIVLVRTTLPRHTLSIDHAGIGPIRWDQLSGVRVIRRDGRSPGFTLELVPAPGADLRRAHRRLTRARDEPLRYRLPLPGDPLIAQRVEQAVQLFAPHLWQGVRRERLDIDRTRRLGKS